MSLRKAFTHGFVTLLALLVGGEALAERTTTYFHTDGLGSVVAATNEAGQVIWRKDYAPFGEQVHATPESERTSYTGKQHDKEIGLTYFGGRYFDPEVGRFVSVDPVGFVEDNAMSFNRCLYVNNNPYKYVDPDGQFLNFAVKFVADVAITVAINYATSGSLGIGAALKDSAMGVLNPAKTIVKAKKLVGLLAKVNKVAPHAAVAKSARSVPQLKPGSAGGPTAGQRFPERVRDAAKAENPTATCVFCRRDGTGTQVDHAIPRARGGNATLDNAQLACPHCNPSKGVGDFPKSPPQGYTGPWPPPS